MPAEGRAVEIFCEGRKRGERLTRRILAGSESRFTRVWDGGKNSPKLNARRNRSGRHPPSCNKPCCHSTQTASRGRSPGLASARKVWNRTDCRLFWPCCTLAHVRRFVIWPGRGGTRLRINYLTAVVLPWSCNTSPACRRFPIRE